VVKSAEGEQLITAEHVVIATGSLPVSLPALPFGGHVISSSELLAMTAMPQRLAVVGGGYIGLELGIAYRKLGAEVTVIEALDRLLPHYDAELTRPVAARMGKLGIKVHLKAKALGLADTAGGLTIEQPDGTRADVPADAILVTVGRRANIDGWGLEGLQLAMNGRFVRIDEQCRTSMRNVWAIGDVTGEPMLAHRAMAQGEMVAEIMAGHRRAFDKVSVPAVCFTDPEIVSAGLSPDAARAAGIEIVTGSFPFAANGRAMTMEAEPGFVRAVARADNHLVLGLQAVGQGVSELSASFSLALEMGARLEDIAGTIHAHPTLSEAFPEAAMKALGLGLHA
jgi:dihydrolipoamide dehydrogenase